MEITPLKMQKERNFIYFLRNMRRKHRLSLRNEHEVGEVWYTYISPLNAVAGFLALVLVLFIVILTTVAYTPVLDLIPGYPGNKSREMLTSGIMRLDSMEREMAAMQVYIDNVALIMDGKTPVVRSSSLTPGDSVKKGGVQTVARNQADSILRAQIEGQGAYRLNESQGAKAFQGLTAPVKGVAATRFNPREGRFGTGIATATGQQVMAAGDGTVILSMWSPDEGHVVQVQHAGNMITVYKHLAGVVASVGARVKSGEAIGYTGEEGASKKVFEFEIWAGGSPVDPETYIVF